jgi:hypothetical protein
VHADIGSAEPRESAIQELAVISLYSHCIRYVNIYLSPVLLQTWLEDSVSIQCNLSLKYESLGRTEQYGTGCNVRVIAEVPPHGRHFLTLELARLETQRHKYIWIKIYRTTHTAELSFTSLLHMGVSE